MSNPLPPSVTYVYERAAGITYRRAVGSNIRDPISWDSEYMLRETEELWKDIVRKGKSNPALQKVLDHAIIIYRLSKDDPK